MSLASKESVGLNSYDGKRYKNDIPILRHQETVPSRQVKTTEHSRRVLKRRNVNGAFVGPKGERAVLEAEKKNDKSCALQDGPNKTREEEEFETFCDLVEENRQGTSRNISAEVLTVEEISDEADDMKTKGNDLESAKLALQTTGYASGKATVRNGAKRFAQAVKNRLIPVPIRLQRETRRGKGKELEATLRRERSCTDSESVVKENMKVKTATETIEEENGSIKAKPLSPSRLQKLIREKVLSQSQTNSKRANQKTVLLADYMRTLQKHMGIADAAPGSNSPDFSETPFIGQAGKKLGSEDKQDEEGQTAMQRRLQMMQQAIARLPTNFTLLDGDLVKD